MVEIREKRVSVVGGCGFLGSHVVRELLCRGCQVLVIDNLCVGHREYVPPDVEFVHHDITQSEGRLRQLFEGVDYVFNYAAHPYVPDSYSRPLRVHEVNAIGAMQVINAAHEASVKRILQVSSAELYGDAGVGSNILNELADLRIAEDAPVRPHSTYGAAKAAVDFYVQARWREAAVPCIALRQFNCIGERETHPYVVPEIITQLANQDGKRKHAVVRLGNNSRRDFMYAGDAASLAIQLLEKGELGEVYNMGSQQSIDIYDLAGVIAKLMGFSGVDVEEAEIRRRRWEIWSLTSNNAKLWKAIGEQRLTTLDISLLRTIQWYRENGKRWPWE